MEYAAFFSITVAVIYWAYKSGQVVGYEQGYDDGMRRGYQIGIKNLHKPL